MGKKEREKGKRGEREFCNVLKSCGFAGARRGRQFKGTPDSPDVVGLEGFHIEVKRTESLSVYAAYAQACEDAGEVDVPVVAHRRNDKPWLMILKADDFLAILNALEALRARA